MAGCLIYMHRVVSVLWARMGGTPSIDDRSTFHFIIAICVILIFNTVNGVHLSAGNLYIRDDHTRFIRCLSERPDKRLLLSKYVSWI